MDLTTDKSGRPSLDKFFAQLRRLPSDDDDLSIDSDTASLLGISQVPITAAALKVTQPDDALEVDSWTSSVHSDSDSESVYSQKDQEPPSAAVPGAQTQYSPAMGHMPVQAPPATRRLVYDIPTLINNVRLAWDVARDADIVEPFLSRCLDHQRQLIQDARVGWDGRHRNITRSRGAKKLYLKVFDYFKTHIQYCRTKKSLRAMRRELEFEYVEAQAQQRKIVLQNIFAAADAEIEDGDELFGERLSKQLMLHVIGKCGAFMPIRFGLDTNLEVKNSNAVAVWGGGTGQQVIAGPGIQNIVVTYRILR